MATSAIMRREAAEERLFASGSVVGLAAVAAVVHSFTTLNHDEAYFLALAGRLLDGGSFGKDIMDMNPPHVWWMGAIPVWLARQTGLRLEVAAAMFTTLMAVLSLVTVGRLISTLSPERFARGVFLPLAAILVLFVPGYDFGQREHWMVLLTLPYVVACACRLNDTPLARVDGALIGAAACLGFCMKPYFLLVPIASEIWILLQKRRAILLFRPETVAMAITGLVYAALTVLYARSYLEIEVPAALLGYWSYKSPIWEVLLQALVLLAPAAMLLLIAYLTRSQWDRPSALWQAFVIAGGATVVAGLIQMKPWSYHFLPGIAFFALAAVALLASGRPDPDRRGQRRIAVAIVIAIAIVPTGFELARALESGSDRISRLAAVLRSNPGPNRAVFGFITSPRDVFPAVVAARADWAASFCCQYLVAAAARADEAPVADQAKIRAAGLNQALVALSAIRAKKPGVIVIATGDDMLGFNRRRFDYVEWLTAHTDFADVLVHYRETSPIGSFRVFVRK